MLHCESRGAGQDLVMVHGWGMHSGVWSDWADRLSAHCRVHLVDLPGHGLSDLRVDDHLDDWSMAVAEVAPADAWWLGWSLGGLVTMNLARLAPRTVRGLLLVATTPRFVAARDWPCAVETSVFEQFAGQVQTRLERTLLRFAALQVRGSDHSGDLLRALHHALKSRPYPSAGALAAGLRLLQNSDLRNTLPVLNGSLHWLFGERDALVPVNVGTRVPGRHAIIAGAGHAPFLSHARACAGQVVDWVTHGTGTDEHATD
jgi:pimeloyl-[acyl-carrier protein] methyl ester esterase